MSTQDSDRVRRIVSLLDLTNLDDQCDNAAIEKLCAEACTPIGNVAAVCVWPDFVSAARRCLGVDSEIQIATVVNFPSGGETPSVVHAMIDKAIADGATEIDYVLPYTALINGEDDSVSFAIKSVRESVPQSITLKVILETGVLATNDLIQTAADCAIKEGADFIKTSTGKVPVNATLEAGAIMLEAIKGSGADVGFKAAGGIRTVQEASTYIRLADKILGRNWVSPAHFRFGASGLLQEALSAAGVAGAASGSTPGVTEGY